MRASIQARVTSTYQKVYNKEIRGHLRAMNETKILHYVHKEMNFQQMAERFYDAAVVQCSMLLCSKAQR